MTPKEKATKLFDKCYLKCTELNQMASIEARKSYAKKFSIIAVEEVIKEVNQNFTSDRYAYWNEVKTEINNL